MTISENKSKYEAQILEHFLKNMGCHFHPPEGGDGPDGWTESDGKRIGLELTSYFADERSKKGSPQRKSVAGWNDLWAIIDQQRRSHCGLQHNMGSVFFKPDQGPTQKTRHQLANEIIRISEMAWRDRNKQPVLPGMKPEPVIAVFIEDRSTRGNRCYQNSGKAHIHLDGQRFPEVAKHIQQIHLERSVVSWPEWWGPDMRPGSPTYNSDILAKLLREKENKIRNRCRSNGNPEGCPEWLIILCDLEADICTDIFNALENGHQNINSFFSECGYDFSDCPMDQIWLMSEKSGESHRVYPFPKPDQEETL